LETFGTEHVAMDTSDQQIFPWIQISYISGRSDKNQVNRSVTVEDRSQEKSAVVQSTTEREQIDLKGF
jgi:hypothetical protein